MPERFPFRQRGHEVSRIEAFSDVVFGFALTLIVVSLEVPRNYEELVAALRGFPAFAICFAILIWIWYAHYVFWRRYALNDGFTIFVNSCLLFVVLFYVYPLKFLFSLVTGGLRGGGIESGSARVLFGLYGSGFAGVFLFFFLLYRHALSQREALGLTPVELHDTRTHMVMYAANVLVGLLSLALAVLLPSRLVGFAGWIYFLVGICQGTIGSVMGARRRAVEDAMGAAAG